MLQINEVRLIANLVRDPEPGTTTKGSNFTHMELAVNNRHTNRVSGERIHQPLFIHAYSYGESAEFCYHNLKKGDAVYLLAELQQENYDDKKTGQPKSRIILKVIRAHFANNGSRKR